MLLESTPLEELPLEARDEQQRHAAGKPSPVDVVINILKDLAEFQRTSSKQALRDAMREALRESLLQAVRHPGTHPLVASVSRTVRISMLMTKLLSVALWETCPSTFGTVSRFGAACSTPSPMC